MLRVVRAEQDERRVPEAPDRPAYEQGGPLAQRQEPGQQVSSPAPLLPERERREQERPKREGQQPNEHHRLDGTQCEEPPASRCALQGLPVRGVRPGDSAGARGDREDAPRPVARRTRRAVRRRGDRHRRRVVERRAAEEVPQGAGGGVGRLAGDAAGRGGAAGALRSPGGAAPLPSGGTRLDGRAAPGAKLPQLPRVAPSRRCRQARVVRPAVRPTGTRRRAPVCRRGAAAHRSRPALLRPILGR